MEAYHVAVSVCQFNSRYRQISSYKLCRVNPRAKGWKDPIAVFADDWLEGTERQVCPVLIVSKGPAVRDTASLFLFAGPQLNLQHAIKWALHKNRPPVKSSKSNTIIAVATILFRGILFTICQLMFSTCSCSPTD